MSANIPPGVGSPGTATAVSSPDDDFSDVTLEGDHSTEESAMSKGKNSRLKGTATQTPQQTDRPAPVERGVSEVAGEIMPITREEFWATAEALRPRVTSAEKDVYVNRLIEHLATTEAVPIPGCDVSRVVEILMDTICGNLDGKFKGQLQRCGSFYEGIKLDLPNEFDYIYELDSINGNALHCEQVSPETFKPRKNERVRPRSYFKLHFNQVPAGWECSTCSGCSQGTPCISKYLDPRKTQQEFMEAMSNAMLRSCGVNEITGTMVKCNGPAVTLYMKLSKDAMKSYVSGMLVQKKWRKSKTIGSLGKAKQNFFQIKIDITLAIPLTNENPERYWFPLQGLSLKPTDFIDPSHPIQRCHLVASGDFWKASFSLQETDAVQQQLQSEGRKQCFQVLKHLRDKLAIEDEQGADVLSTYPIKVAFLQECHNHQFEEDWNFWNRGSRTMSILKRVEREGKDGMLTSYVVQDEPILMESDKCYMESRRIQDYLMEEHTVYKCHGKIHATLLSAYWILAAILLCFSINYLIEYNNSDLPVVGSCTIKIDPAAKLQLGNYLFSLIGLTILMFVISVIGLVVVIGYRCTWVKGVLYDLYCSAMYTYLVLLLVSVVFLFLGLWLAAGYRNLFAQCITMYQVQAFTITNIALAGVVIAGGLLHLTTVTALMRCRCSRFGWECVLPDQLWSKCGKKYCCCWLPADGASNRKGFSTYQTLDENRHIQSENAPQDNQEHVVA